MNNRNMEYDSALEGDLRGQLSYAESVIDRLNLEIEELRRKVPEEPDAMLARARVLAAKKAKYPLVKQQILMGLKDSGAPVLDQLRTLKREALFRANGITEF